MLAGTGTESREMLARGVCVCVWRGGVGGEGREQKLMGMKRKLMTRLLTGAFVAWFISS